MRSYLNTKVMAFAVAVLVSFLGTSCVNEEYEISQDRLDLKVTLFQEGISFPLGSTEQIRLEKLYSKLNGNITSLIQAYEGAYMFRKSDVLEVSDNIAGALSDVASLDALSFSETFNFALGNIDLSGVTVPGRHIAPKPIDLGELLEDFDIDDLNSKMPAVDVKLPSINVSITTPNVGDLELDLSSIAGDLANETEIAKLSNVLTVPETILNMDLAAMEMDYSALRNAFPQLNLPELLTAFEFDPYTVEVPVRFTLPKEIKDVKSIELNKDASFELTFEIENSLFTSGSVVPELDIDLHNLLYIDRIESGINDGASLEENDSDNDGVFEQHVKSRFVMSGSNGWKSNHVYHVESLAIKPSDWKKEGENLVIDKVIPITMSGELKGQDLKTTLRYLSENCDKVMKVKMDIKFNNFNIDDVQMELDPIVRTESLEVLVGIDNISLGTDLVEKVDYFDLDPQHPLTLSLNTVLPDKLKSLDLTLKSLVVEFPEGMVINDKGSVAEFNQQTRQLVYSNVALNEGFNDQVVVERVYLPDLVDNTFSYSGTIKVTAEAVAGGILSSKELIEGEDGDLTIEGGVTYEPKLKDFAVVINDYEYDVQFEPIVIHETLAKEIGDIIGSEPLLVNLKKTADGKNQKIEIYINYPDHSAITLAPKQGVGFQLDFPDMFRFNQQKIPASYNFNPDGNVMTFTSSDALPKSIVLEIENLELNVVKSDVNLGYEINDLMTVTGGVCLKGTVIHLSDINELKNLDNATVSFEAIVPDIEPAQFGLDEYEKTLEEEIPIDKIETTLPDEISSIRMQELLLKDTYLNLVVDASSVKDIIGDVDMTLSVEIVLPKMFMIKSESEGVTYENNVLKINGKIGKDYKIAVDGIRIEGLDLSEIEIKDGKLSVDVGNIPVKGSVKLKDLTIDLASLEGKKLAVDINGYLATVDDKKEPTESIQIDKITGYVGYGIEPIATSVDLSAIALAVNEGDLDITIDLHTYYLALDVNTNIDIPVTGKLGLTPYFGSTPGTTAEPTLVLDPEARKDDCYNIFISNFAPESPESEGRYDSYKDHQYIPLDLISLISKTDEAGKQVIADSLQVEINAGTDADKLCTIEPAKEYHLGAEYEIGVPLAFGDDFAVEYRDTISGFSSRLKKIFEYGSVGVSGKFVNGFPLNFEVQLNPMDSNDNIIPVTQDAAKQRISACDKKGNPVTTDLRFVLSGKGTGLSDLQAFELILRVDAKGAGGVPLKPDSYIQVSLNALVPDGITIDAKEYAEEVIPEGQN